MDIYKYLNISFRIVIKKPKILKFVPDCLKTKKIFNHTIKK